MKERYIAMIKKNIIPILSTVLLLASIVFSVRYCIRYYRTRDILGPTIRMDSGEIYVSVNDPETQLLSGVTAQDAKDGDVTASLLVESLSDFIAEDTRVVHYAAVDSDNHVAKASRRMVYIDYTPVVFTLDKPLRFTTSSVAQDYLGALHARDCLDGDISDQVVFTADSVINTNTAADYKVALEVTNSAGDTQILPVTITLYDSYMVSGAPTIELSNYLVYIGVGEVFEPLDYISNVVYRNVDYEPTDRQGTFAVDTSEWDREDIEEFKERDPAVNRDLFQVTNLVNNAVPGTYEVEYSLTDLEGNCGSVRLIVIVEEDA